MATNDLSFMQEPTEVSPGAAELVSELLANLPPSATQQGPPTGAGRVPGQPPTTTEQFIETLDFGNRPVQPKVGTGKRILGGIGDALLAYAQVMAGGVPSGVGPFAARTQANQAAFEERSVAFDDKKREVANRIRVRDFEAKRTARIKTNAPPDTHTKDRTIFVTQDMINGGEFGQADLGVGFKVSDVIGDDSGKTLGRTVLGRASGPEKNNPGRGTAQMTIDADMAKRHPNLAGHEGEFAHIAITYDKSNGATTGMEILGPGSESIKFINTADGIVGVGSKSGIVREAFLGADGEPMKPFTQVVMENKIRREAADAIRGELLPPATMKAVTEQGIAQDSIKDAVARYEFLGRPDIGRLFTMKADRDVLGILPDSAVKSDEGILARAAISSVIVPIRKFFSGAAVTPTEAKASEPLIAILETGVAPIPLMASLLELSNMTRRARKRILMDARANGHDISGYEHELTDGSLESHASIDSLLSGENQAPAKHGGIFVDADGNLQRDIP